MEWVSMALQADVAKLKVDAAQAEGDYNALRESKTTLQNFFAALLPERQLVMDFVVTSYAFADWPPGVAPVDVKKGFLQLLEMYMLVLAGCLFNPPVDALNMIVASLHKPVAWKTLYDIIDIAMADIFQLIRQVTVVEIPAVNLHRSLRDKLFEACRQSIRVQWTCKRCCPRLSTVASCYIGGARQLCTVKEFRI
jgi:hypothetical protein